MLRRLPCIFLFLLIQTRVSAEEFCGYPLPQNTVLCPRKSQLNYSNSTLLWSTKDGWKSTQPSTSKSIRRFVGAQWNGWNTGQVICVYEPVGENEFHISLTISVPIIKPKSNDSNASGIWSDSLWKETNRNPSNFQATYNCPAPNDSICSCPLEVFTKKELSTKEILESIRRDPFNQSVFTLN